MAKGYWIRKQPETETEAAVQFGPDRIASIVKKCLLDYIGSFLSSDGKNRVFLKAAFPSMSIYLSDEHKVDLAAADPGSRYIQLSGLYERVKETLPCILLDDASITYVSSGIGKCCGTALIDGKSQIWFHVVRDVGVSCIIGATDMTTCSNIRDSVSVMFGEICKFVCGNILTMSSDGSSSWEVQFKNQMDLGNTERVQAGSGDSVNKFVAFSTGVINCRFEGNFAVETQATTYELKNTKFTYSLAFLSGIAFGKDSDGNETNTMKVGTVAVVEIVNAKPFGMFLNSTDARVVSLEKISETKFRLLSRKPGTVKIQLVDGNSAGRIPFSSFSHYVMCEKTVTVDV